MNVAGLQPLGRPSGGTGCCDSSRQQQAAGPGPPSGLPLSGTSCVCGQQPLLSLLVSSVLSPLPLSLLFRILCICAPCLVTLVTLHVDPQHNVSMAFQLWFGPPAAERSVWVLSLLDD